VGSLGLDHSHALPTSHFSLTMSNINVTIDWDRQNSVFTDNRYSRVHYWTFDGGSKIVASSSPQIVPIPMSDASAVDPEEAFVAALSSCHMLWFLSLAAKKGLCVNSYSDHAVGEMGRNENCKLVITRVRLRPLIQWEGQSPDERTVEQLHHAAHGECFIANSVRTEVLVESPMQDVS